MSYNKKPYEEDYDFYKKTEEDLSLGSILIFGAFCLLMVGIMISVLT